jgi:hypothetical protein
LALRLIELGAGCDGRGDDESEQRECPDHDVY